MAISKEIWDKAKFLFELGKSLSDIERDTGVSKSQISKKAKKEGWQKEKKKQLKSDIVGYETKKETLEQEKETIVSKLASLQDYEITLMDGIVEDEVGKKSLIFSTQSLALIRNNQILTKNSKTVMLKVAQYGEKGKDSEDYEPYEVPLGASDIKEIIESTDKAAITLKVADRHAPKTEISNTNANQVNLTPNEITKAISEALPD